MRRIDHIVIHCSGSPNGDARTTRDAIERLHREVNGWSSIGYHYVIHVDGSRHDGVHITRPGAHVRGNNLRSVGVCLVGTDRFTHGQWVELAVLVGQLQASFPAAAVKGHRDYSPDLDGDGLVEKHEWLKICPGFDVADWLAAGMDPQWNPAHLQVPA